MKRMGLTVLLVALAGCSVQTRAGTPARMRASGSVGVSATTSGSADGFGAAYDSEDVVSSGNAQVECHGADHITLQDRVIETGGDGVEAHSACTVTLVRCRIRAGGVALRAHGKSKIVVRDSEVEGRLAAAELHGASHVELSNTKLRGKIEKHGLSELHDAGKNRFE